jgi:hypothetical protein
MTIFKVLVSQLFQSNGGLFAFTVRNNVVHL